MCVCIIIQRRTENLKSLDGVVLLTLKGKDLAEFCVLYPKMKQQLRASFIRRLSNLNIKGCHDPILRKVQQQELLEALESVEDSELNDLSLSSG